MEIYVHRHGEQSGPFTQQALVDAVHEGTFSNTDFGWHEGLDGWKPIVELLPSSRPISTPPKLPQVADFPREEILRPPVFGSCLMAGVGLGCVFVMILGLMLGKWLMVLAPLPPCVFLLGKYGLRLLPNAAFLKMSPEGMLIRDFYETTFFRWDEIGDFELRDEVPIRFHPESDRQRTRIVVHSKAGEGLTPRKVQLPVLETKPHELVKMLGNRLHAHLACVQAGNCDPPPLPAGTESISQSQRACEIAGYVSVLLALVACPPVFGVSGFVLGKLLEKKWRSQHAKPIKSMSIAFAIAGIVIGIAVAFLLDWKAENDAMERSPYSPQRLKEYMSKPNE